jgi:asparagine synthetase B (glutamine-hydrolysing)
MPDFLLSLDPHTDPESLLALAQKPYGQSPPPGRTLRFPWGALAILDDAIARGQNRISESDLTFAWVGDLILHDRNRVANDLAALAADSSLIAVQKSKLFDRLNGAFAAALVSNGVATIITDPMSSVQVYAGKSDNGKITALGTHPDLVATLSSPAWQIDPVSISDFLNGGVSCCPHTMHRNVTEVAPGTVLIVVDNGKRLAAPQSFQYWTPPAEVRGNGHVAELADEFVSAWKNAIASRCDGNYAAVTLSGGFDSRVVLAAIPNGKKHVTVTLCDSMNREATFAKRVAECYQADWVPLRRDPEYLGNSLVPSTRFTGCEGEFHHGHAIGFASQLRQMGVDNVFTGLLMDNNFKGYYARDLVRIPRAGGLLPAQFQIRPLDYVNQITDFTRGQLQLNTIEGVLERRRVFAQNHFATKRESAWEWLDGFPNSQACDNTGWVIERRVMPMRLPVMDRALVDLAFKIPVSAKAGGAFFERAAVKIMGPGRLIPSANDGVRPGSGHVSRLLQRAVRKTQRTIRTTAAKAGVELQVPHSWHDFPRYLNESSVLTDLIQKHGERLREFEGSAFKTDPVKLLRNPQVPWAVGYRLIQLAVWRSLLDDYRK